MIKLFFRPSFVRQVAKLEKDLAEEVYEKVELFRDEKNHEMLKVHKLHGVLSGRFSFSINYKYRVVFRYQTPKEAVLLTIGGHDIYK